MREILFRGKQPAADVVPKVNDAEGGRQGEPDRAGRRPGPDGGLGHVVHSSWLIEVEGNGWGEWDNLTCKHCGKKHKKVAWPSEWHYCPNCGAKMDGEGGGG